MTHYYRTSIKQHPEICSYEVIYKDTSLFIRSAKNYSNKILRTLISLRKPLERYIQKHPEFLTSLKPLTPQEDAPKIVRKMCEASQKTNTGPMSCVAGAVAEFLGYEMLKWIKKENLKEFLIIENGGDIFCFVDEDITVAIYAGENSPFTGRLKLKISILSEPLGICTSSGTVGHSFSFGKADAAVIVSNSCIFSDTLATATANLVKTEKDLKDAVEFAKKFDEVLFVCAIKNKSIAFWSKTSKIEVI